MRKVVLASIVGVGLVAGGHTYVTRAQQTSVTLSILFDGGYGFVMRDSKGFEVINLKEGANGHSDHQMKLRLERGAVESGPAPLSPGALKEWELKDLDLRIGSYGNSPAGFEMPATETPTEAAPANNSKAANNLAFFPNLLKFHKDLVVGAADRAQSRVLLDRGRLAILRVGGCWDFKTPTSTMASGVAVVRGNSAIKYNLNLDEPVVKLTLSPVGKTAPVQTLVLKPDANGEVVVKIGDFRPAPVSLAIGERLEHFDHLYNLFETPPPQDQRLGMFKCAELTPVAPGDECPPGLFLRVPDTQ